MCFSLGELPISEKLILAYHTHTSDAWEAMLAACAAAEQTIDVEEFVFQPDPIGERFAEVFINRAKAGVKVRLLLDWWGCKKLIGTDLLTRLTENGVDVRFFRPPSWSWVIKAPRFFPRDHRKIFIIDDTLAYTGGVCIQDSYRDWRDTMVKVRGTLVDQLKHIFDQTWHKTYGAEEEIKAHPDFTDAKNFSVYANAPDSGEHNYSNLLIKKLDNAEKSIRLVTPYFTPGDHLLTKLNEALARGVSVEIILSNYSKYAPYVVGKMLSGDLIKRGAKIYYFEPTMLHLKVMIIDGNWSALGSCNLDGLSLNHNQEVMIASDDDDFTSTLMQHFEGDIKQSNRFDHRQWQHRPLSEKWMGHLLSPFSHYL